MSRKFLTPIDLSGLELQNFVVHNLTSDPTGIAGRLYFDSNTGVKTLKYYDGSTWKTLSTGSGSFYLGSTSISLGNSSGDVTSIAGLSSVSSTSFTGALTGNASTATTLQTARAINGVNFDGSAAITITAAAGTLTGTTLNSGVTASSLTSVGTLTSLTTSGDVTVGGNLTVNGTTTTVNSTTITVDDKNLELGSVASPTDTTADGGGITLKGDTDKTLNWVNATDAWTSSEHIDLASGKALYIAGTSVLNATNLGTNVVNSSLTKVGLSSAGFVKSDSSGNLSVDTATYTKKVTGAGAASSGTTIVVNHALGQWVTAQLFDTSTGAQVEVDVTHASTSGGTTTFTFASSVSDRSAYTYVIVG
jgi:hypothetical protein